MTCRALAVAVMALAFLPLGWTEGEPFELDVQAAPRVVTAGEGTILTATAVADGLPVAGVSVQLTADGGAFGLAARDARGVTDEQGLFRAVWRTGPVEEYPEARFHVVDYTATKEGSPPVTGRILVRVVPAAAAPVPAPSIPHLFVTARATPPFVAAGGTTVIAAAVRSGAPNGAPVAGAQVRLAADGGRFEESGLPTLVARTDRAGFLRVQWSAAPAEQYRQDRIHVFTLTVERDGIADGRARLEVAVTGHTGSARPAPARLRPMSVVARAEPASIAAGGAAVITVLARADSAQGAPLAGATVEVSSPTGRLDGQPGGHATGVIDRAGQYQVEWRAEGRAGAQETADHVIAVRVGYPGYQTSDAHLQVHVEAGPTPPAASARTLVLDAAAEPATVSAGGTATIAVRVRTSQRNPVPAAVVTLSAGGGTFVDTNRPRITGRTGADGIFRATWRTEAASQYPEDLEYAIAITASQRGLEDGHAEISLTVLAQPATTPAPARNALQVQAMAAPTTIGAGGNTAFLVLVRTPDGRPVADAGVRLSMGGGAFKDFPGTQAVGKTARDGRFRAFWRTGDPRAILKDMDFVADVVAFKPGYVEGRAQVTVHVTANQAAPGARQMAVAIVAQQSAVPAGSAVRLAVRVLDAAGQPVPAATVDLVADGGRLAGGTGAQVTGTTDAKGMLQAVWQTDAAYRYSRPTPIEIRAVARKTGYAESRGKTTVTVTPVAIK